MDEPYKAINSTEHSSARVIIGSNNFIFTKDYDAVECALACNAARSALLAELGPKAKSWDWFLDLIARLSEAMPDNIPADRPNDKVVETILNMVDRAKKAEADLLATRAERNRMQQTVLDAIESVPVETAPIEGFEGEDQEALVSIVNELVPQIKAALVAAVKAALSGATR